MEDKLKILQEMIHQGKRILFFTGAGVSVASGIPDFRSQDGLYNQQYAYPPETIISHHFFYENTKEFYRFYKDKMLYPAVKPNQVHHFIAETEKKGKGIGVITQNIDGLHQKAGSKNVYELHGSVARNYCIKCHEAYTMEDILHTEDVPYCTKCGGLIKPDVVLYEEPLDEAIMHQALVALSKADTLIVLGTSLVVYPAAGLLRYFTGNNLILINKSTTPYDDKVDLCIHADFKDVFDKLTLD
ncbi:MAG: NAD-dependent protein deacylase [Solobacterium sp.]|nr:NAD-dependent protein deacylase [Solobacterium sp.]